MSKKERLKEAALEAEFAEMDRVFKSLLVTTETMGRDEQNRLIKRRVVPVSDDEISASREKIMQMGLSHSELIDYAAREAAAGAKSFARLDEYELVVGIFEANNPRAISRILRDHFGENIVAQALLKAMDRQRVITAGQGARGKANGKAGIAKAEAKRLWGDWQAGKMLHKNQAAFARYVVDNVPDLISPKNVESWCTAWRKEKEAAAKNR